MHHVDLFAGIGGFSLGFDRAGATTSAIVEWDANCQQLLGRRFPGVPIHGDINEVRGAELGRVDILTGGFPCQDVSLAGARAGLAGERSGHFWEFARIIDETRPEWVVIENVRGLLSSGGRRDMGSVLGALGDLGYGFAYRVLDAQFFGVPQRRHRVFIVGRVGADRDGAAAVLLEPEGVPGAAGESGQARRPDAEELAARAAITSRPLTVRMRSGKEGGGKGALVSERSLTIATGNDQTVFQPLGRSFVVRKLTPVECERLQGFPDHWTGGFPDTTRYRMLGNAVAVPVVEWIARRLLAVSNATLTEGIA